MRYEHTFQVRASQSQVADFHTQAASLTAITPSLIPLQLHDTPERLHEGDRMCFTMGFGALAVRWIAQIEDVSPSGFRDRQLRGPFEEWSHHHSFVALDERTTRVRDEIQATLKRHPLWGPAGLVLWLSLPALFWFRGWKTRRLLEASPHEPAS